jgi:3-oxoacyl-[acyl-carrier protein] reductase
VDLAIKNRVALVTGASRGIGAAVCSNLLREGAIVIGIGRSSSDLDEIRRINSNFHPIELDLTGVDSIQELASIMRSMSLSPDIIVNNLGGNLGITNPMCSYQEFMEVMRFNFGIAMDLNNLFIPSMIKREWGRICHVSSISALENQGPPAYGAAKAAINAYVRSLSRYLAEKNVVINGVMPGAIFTEGGYWDDVSRNRPDHLTKYLEERMAIKRLGELSEISELITFLVSEHASFMVGSNVLADGGQGRVFTAIE